MKSKRVFKTKTFSRWAKKLITDERLCNAAKEIMKGQHEGDLGSGLCKKRIAVAGQGKSGATRTLVAKESTNGIFFVAGRQKSDPGTDFSDSQVSAAKIIGTSLQKANGREIEELISDGVLKEICHDEC